MHPKMSAVNCTSNTAADITRHCFNERRNTSLRILANTNTEIRQNQCLDVRNT
ncbi:MAG: hypothetical protein MJ025_01265 [Victivallaceae bacterium]|nr:hypothetical protein [Victivallaceae bacterium]